MLLIAACHVLLSPLELPAVLVVCRLQRHLIPYLEL